MKFVVNSFLTLSCGEWVVSHILKLAKDVNIYAESGLFHNKIVPNTIYAFNMKYFSCLDFKSC